MTRHEGLGLKGPVARQDVTYLAAARPANDAQKGAFDESIDESIAYQGRYGGWFCSFISFIIIWFGSTSYNHSHK